nr:transposase [Chloroflexota bacterium]
MSTRWRPIFDPTHLYFVTTATANRTQIFRRDIIKRTLVDALYFTSLMNNTHLFAFVVMPNHIHVIIQCTEGFPLQKWTRAFKTCTSQLIVRLYQMEQNWHELSLLATAGTQAGTQRYKVWENGYLAKNVVGPEFLIQKLTYIHNNPVQSHWQLASAPEEYQWSSARFYLQDDKECLIPIQDVRELLA